MPFALFARLILKYLCVEASLSGIYLPLHIGMATLRHDNPTETQCFIVRPSPLVLFEVRRVQWRFPCGLQFPFHLKRHPGWINMVKFQSSNLTTQPSFSRFNFHLTLLQQSHLIIIRHFNLRLCLVLCLRGSVYRSQPKFHLFLHKNELSATCK